ncbi:hypothetical protein SAMCCGM7_pA0072 (plasmid) [Sinorhizobium americanum CCGM7]|nr:hypothetical protein SAMCCGM7_pA0072 [Sinorhizobium americanum CCGM7]
MQVRVHRVRRLSPRRLQRRVEPVASGVFASLLQPKRLARQTTFRAAALRAAAPIRW